MTFYFALSACLCARAVHICVGFQKKQRTYTIHNSKLSVQLKVIVLASARLQMCVGVAASCGWLSLCLNEQGGQRRQNMYYEYMCGYKFKLRHKVASNWADEPADKDERGIFANWKANEYSNTTCILHSVRKTEIHGERTHIKNIVICTKYGIIVCSKLRICGDTIDCSESAFLHTPAICIQARLLQYYAHSHTIIYHNNKQH